MSSKTGLSNKLPFLIVQEGIWKNQASERVRECLAARFCDRAEIELRYIRLLQDWLDDIDIPIDKNDGSDSYMDSPIVKSVVGCLKTEARSQIIARQRIYNAIMNDLGPYCAIRSEVVTDNKSLKWAEETFNSIDRDRRRYEKDHRLHSEKKEHVSNQIEAIESQLSQRSRITSARRPSRQGAKKVDAMRQRVSFLRKQLQQEEEIIKRSQRELVTLETKSTSNLGKMEAVLKELERIRTKNILQQTKMFIQSMLNHQTQARRSACTSDTLRQCLTELNETDKHIDKTWEDVEINAQRSQAGQTFKLRQLFEVPAKRPKSADSRRSHDSLKIAEIEANRLNEGLDEISQRQESPDLDISLQRSHFDEDFAKSKQGQSTKTSTNSKHRKARAVSSDTSIEDLHLPPETRNSKTRTDNAKDFWMKSENPDLDGRTASTTEYTKIDQFDKAEAPVASESSGSGGSDESGILNVGRLRNIRVCARFDYTAHAPGEISFRKGQTIKQKSCENEAGFCYGWVRDHRLFPKRYGYYPANAVCLIGFEDK